MPHVEVIEPEAAQGQLAEIYSEILRTRGQLSNIWTLQSLVPEFIRVHREMNVATMFGTGGLSRVERETIAVAVSAANECHY